MIPLNRIALVRKARERIAAKRSKQQQAAGDDPAVEKDTPRRKGIGPKLAH